MTRWMKTGRCFEIEPWRWVLDDLVSLWFAYFFTIWSLVTGRPLLASTTWVKYKLKDSRGMLLGCLNLLDGQPEGRNNIFHGFIYRRRRDGMRGRNLGFLGSRNTPDLPSLEAKLPPRWYMVYRRPLKREAIFPKWMWFHPRTYTWHGGGTDYHPHCALMFGALDPCDMILSRKIL